MKDFVYGNKNKDTILNDYVNMFKVVLSFLFIKKWIDIRFLFI